VDMARLHDAHYKTIENNAKLTSEDEAAQKIVAQMTQEGNALLAEYRALVEQANSPALSAEAKAKAQADAEQKVPALEQKEQDINTFIQNTRNTLSQKLQQFRGFMLEEIAALAADIAKRQGATLLLDKSGV